MSQTQSHFLAGAAEADITPARPQVLVGYPNVPRTSTGVLDPLFASALYFRTKATDALLVGCDLIWVPRNISERARRRISLKTGMAAERIMLSGTHTHSGPVMSPPISGSVPDPVVPPPDEEYLRQVEDGIVQAAEQAHSSARPACVKFALADGSSVGTNRRHPEGPALPQTPVLWCEDLFTHAPIAVMAVCSMHATVLHEDSTLISGDFPGQARQYLKRHVTGAQCPFVYFMGTSGNQSPRHVTRANTVAETQRLGEALGRAIAAAAGGAEAIGHVKLAVQRTTVELPLRTMPRVEDAAAALDRATEHYETLRTTGAARPVVRTAECDLFGAQKTLRLAQAAARGELAAAARDCMPAEIQAIHIGPHVFVGWPGEVFVEFALQVRQMFPQAWIITLANSHLNGYLVTQQAIDEHAYEATNALFASPEAGQKLVHATTTLLQGSAPCPAY